MTSEAISWSVPSTKVQARARTHEALATAGLDRRRRSLQIALGLVWLLDAALQYQPYMFTKGFPQQAIATVGPGNPGWVAHPVHWAAQLMAGHIIEWDALFATLQLLIAVGLLSRRTVKLALAGSVVWAVMLWWMGEGLGGILVAPQSPVMGAPGAAIIYALIAFLVWPRRDTPTEGAITSVATRSPLGAIASRLAWLVLWGSFGFETLQAANRAPSALHDMVAGMADGEPAWIRAIDRTFAIALADHGTEVSIALAVTFALIGLASFGGASLVRTAIITAVVLSALIWVVGENFGGIATGEATDPNSGLLLILLAAVYWPLRASAKPAPGTGSNPAAWSA
jgi:hypothetical protein